MSEEKRACWREAGLERAKDVYPERPAAIYDTRRYSWREVDARVRRLASALTRRGVEPGDVVSVLAANTPELVEAHFGVPLCGAVLNTVNSRLDPETIAYTLEHTETTAEAFADGRFHSGDLAVVHPDGYVEIKDRLRDVIISGGENISSVEVESVLYKHGAVAACAVVAKPDEKWGETPWAFIELKDGATAEEGEIIAFCREHLPGFKAPKRVVFGELPKTATGKIQKFALRQTAREL